MRTSSGLVRLALALTVSVLAGVVLAGLAFPVVGGLGLIGKKAADTFNVLPEKPPTLALPQRSRILDKNGNVLATLFVENRVQVTLAAVPLLARQALIAIEDSRFYEHRGIDVKGSLRALARNSSSGAVQQGGSTLTQQYVKNMLIETARTQAAQKAAIQLTVKRKLQEAKYALYLERTMSKNKILEGYLNIAYYGSGVYGIGTAANHYFGVPVNRLSLAQGALLAGMVQNPSGYDPTVHPRASVARRNVVLTRMEQLGYITATQRAKAVREPLRLHVTSVKSGCEAPGVTAPFFCDYVRRYLEDGPAGAALGATLQERQQRLLTGGLTIRTTLDPMVQQAAQQAIDTKVPAHDPFGAVAVADTVEPGTGNVRAMAVDRTFGDKAGETKVNFALGGSVGFQGGSTFKAFVLARALQMGISPHLTLHAPQRYCPTAFPYVAGDGKCGPQNAGDSESGTFDMVSATWASVNTYFIQLEERTGLITPPGLAEALGVRQLDGTFTGGSLPRTNPSFVLGTPTVSPLAMAGAYAAFAQHGLFCPPRPVLSITDSSGHDVALKAAPCTQVLEPAVADTVTSILRGVIDGPLPGRTGAGASIGRPAAGKTGTTDDSTAAWFIGYTPQLSTAVWMGLPTPTSMRGVTINGQYYSQVYGGTIPAAIWKALMTGALSGVPVENFSGASLALSNGQKVAIPDVTGQPIQVATDLLRQQGFAVTVGPAVNAGPIPTGRVGSTTPATGTQVAAGSTVTLHPSNGHAPVTATTSPTPGAPATQRPTGAPTSTPGGSPAPAHTPKPRAGR
ncbi:MAG: glycosyl transferase, family 51 [Frankiales bacterium]|nr:glycosyl transferase, family 51 [Frankiales bacterium]